MFLLSLQAASQLDSLGSVQVDIKYEDYPFTPTSGTDYTRTALPYTL